MPAPRLDDLGALVERIREAGVDVVLTRRVPAAALSPLVELNAYRIVQEALTNVVKHAGPVRATVKVMGDDTELTVTIRDEGPPMQEGLAEPGHGITGMLERARILGGTLRAGPLPGGGYEVLGRFPDLRPTNGAAAAARGRHVIKVVVADDQVLLRAGIAGIVNTADDMTVVGQVGDGSAAVATTQGTHPDVVLMDIRMPVLDGIEATRQIVDSTNARVVILTTFDLDQYVYEALRSGASGFLVKDTPPADLLAAVRTVAAGDALLSPSVTRRLIERVVKGGDHGLTRPQVTLPDTVTRRERDVLALVAAGKNNHEIAEQLHIGIGTAKTHVARLLAKLDARDRVQLVIRAHGLDGDPHRSSPD